MTNFWIKVWKFKYRFFLRPVFFRFKSEAVHVFLVRVGAILGRSKISRGIIAAMLVRRDERLTQIYHGVIFKSPVGLSAGFDYRADLMDIAPSLGFGFTTIGTITNNSCEGNPAPRLGRLVKSKSLWVNKGFKNDGITAIIAKCRGRTFALPIGISIGKTNSPKPMTQKEAVDDIVAAFRTTEKITQFSYYELNISCPNLYGSVTFYPPKNLRELLESVCAIKLRKPLFIKMPIEKSDDEVRAMLDVIVSFPVAGVIFGNLPKNKDNPALVPSEANRYSGGAFSGKPAEKRSNELIALAYKEYGKRLTIIGCGGIFNAENAYKKIRLGASLLQLITGLVFEGPQLPAEINSGLARFLERDKFTHLRDAIGVDVRA